ncbi:ATP-binding protein [Streptomyces sp. NPDC054932]
MLVLDSTHTNTALARRAVRRFLQAKCPWADVNDVLLVVSELLGNAVRHTAGAWLLRMTCRQEALVVEVHDSSTTLPVPRAGDPENGGGFGWGIVQQLASSVTVRPHWAGKSVQDVWRPALQAQPA